MAAGLAVAGTLTSPEFARPWVEDGARLLAPVGDAEALGAALVRLAREAELRRALGTRNRERVQADFGEARMLEEHVELILGGLVRDRTGRRAAAR